MGTIMRGDQTLRLIQLYYNNYPEIARNTQDADGRRARGQMWQQITDELNSSYETSFSVEQYKKKIQNVQCTSRQKIQAGKRNLGVAEFEYLRLFEQERLSTNPINSDAYDSTMTRSSSADLSTNVKVEQMLEKFGITIDPQVFQAGNFGQDIQAFETGSASDSDSSNTTTNPSSIIDSTAPLSKSPPAFPALLPTLPNQMDPRQLIFALSQLNQFNQEICNVNTLTSVNNQLTINNSTKITPELPPANLDEKLPRQTSPTIKRSLEDNETLMRMFTAKKKRMNGIFGSQGIQGGDEKWKKEMAEIQQQILDNQSKILEHMDRKQELAQVSLNQANFSTIESKLEKLCDSITLLNETLKDGLLAKKPIKVVDE